MDRPMDRHIPIVSWLRAEIARIWRAHLAGEPLSSDDQLVADRLAAHPEWADWWAQADDLGDAGVLTPEGVDPFLRISIEGAVEGMIWEDVDPVVRQTYSQLLRNGFTDEEAKEEIGKAFLAISWTVANKRISKSDKDKYLHLALRRLSAGERIDEIFPYFYE